MTKGIEIKDLTVGAGDEATKQSVVVANIRQFLRRGDEVSHSPLTGTRRVIDLGRRESIAGLLHGIPGMRVGGKREIVISPHLAYREVGIPGRIPPNALLRCEVELLEIRNHGGMLPQDWLPGKVLMLRRCDGENDRSPCWNFTVHENGNSSLTFDRPSLDGQRKSECRSEISIPLKTEESTDLIRQAMDLPEQLPEDCVAWDSGFIDMQNGGSLIKDMRSGARCFLVQAMDSGKGVLIIGVHEESTAFLDSPFYRTIERLIRPHLAGETTLT